MALAGFTSEAEGSPDQVGISDAMNRRAVFLDRDGVLNSNIFYSDTEEWESPRTVADFSLIDGVLVALDRLQRASFLLFVVSNQPSFAKGKTTLDDLRAIRMHMEALLVANEILVTEAFYCFHHPQGIVPELAVCCDCRKPSAYFLFEAARNYGLELSESWMVGDRGTDIDCGRAAGVQTIRVGGDHLFDREGGAVHTFRALALPGAVDLILEHIGIEP